MGSVLLVPLTFGVVGCVGNFKEAVRDQAATDFQCNKTEIQLADSKPSAQPTAYLATGCGKEQAYEGGCDFRGCVVEEVPSAEEQQRLADARANQSSAPTADAPSSQGPAAGPQRVSVSIYNACPDTVKLFEGDDPKFGSGRTSSLSHNQTQSFSLKAGDQVWLLDSDGNGVSSLSASPSMARVEVNDSCSGFRPR
jgi:hypothetical protein